jgi:CelD/BcsL family acetyltransferase involved in cellulose biosynthesis
VPRGNTETEPDRIRELEPEWRRLAVSRGNAFLTPEWYRCWLEQYGEDAIPLLSELRDDGGALRGLLPLAISRSGRPRVCRIAGANLGDHFHPVCEPGDEAAVAAAAGEAMAASEEPWSVIGLDHADVERPWVEALRKGVGARLATFSRRSSSLPRIDLTRYDDWDGYLAGLSRNLRGQVRNHERRLGRDHRVELRQTADERELEDDLATFFDLHLRRWVGRGGSSLAGETAQAFHKSFAAAALERGWLRLLILNVDGTPIAAGYGWRLGGRYFVYNVGFDQDWGKYSPGSILWAMMIRSALEEGAAEFDFGLGDEPYKLRFADGAREVLEVTLSRAFPHPAAFVTAADHGMRRAGRAIPPSVRKRLGLARLARRSLLSGRRR